MKYAISFLLVAILAGFLGYLFGLRSQTEDKAQTSLRNELTSNLAIYQALEHGNPDLAKTNLKIFIEANLMTYNFYKTKYADFGSNDSSLRMLIEQANEVAKSK